MSLPVKLAEEILLGEDDFNETLRLINTINHEKCRNATLHNYWMPSWNNDKRIAIIRPNNIFWLYFWAETGKGSRNAARESRIVFYIIFGFDRPYGKTGLDYENFFSIFDNALEKTGLPFRVYKGDHNRNNPIRAALRYLNCTEYCLNVFRQVLINMGTSVSDPSRFLNNVKKNNIIKL